MDGTPAGVTLVVWNGATAGIYAVATLPGHRNRGISRALLTHVRSLARARGVTTLTLQAHQGSYAERLYEGLGFKTAFASNVYVR